MRLGQPDSRSSHWTIALSEQRFYFLLFAFALIHLWLSSWLAPSEDELYYWCWSRNLQWSYFDHAPLVAFLIAASTWILGDSLLAIRFFACIGGVAILWLLSTLTESKRMLGLLFFCPIFFFGSVLMTPDLPLLFFWTCYLLWTVKQCNALSEWEEDPIARVYRPSPILLSQWILGGIILGTGILSKYTMGLAIVCSLLVLATQYRWRAWSRGFILHLVLAAIVASPILIHNLQNGFQPLRFQWEHATDPAHFSFSRAAEFIGVQTLMTGLLPFLMLPWLLIRFRKVVAHPTTRTLFFFFALPLLFFLYRTLRTYTEANWAFISYVAFWPLAQKITERTSFDREIRWLIAISFSVPIAVTCLLAIHLFSPLSIVRPQKDRIWRLTEQFALSKTVASDVNLLQLPVYCHNYQWTAYMRYQKVAASQLPATRPSHFTSPAESPCDHSSILVFTDGSAPEEPLRCFTGKTVIKDYSLSVRGETVGKYQLIQLVK